MRTIQEAQEMRVKDAGRANGQVKIGERAFDDLTDLQNDEFIVSGSRMAYPTVVHDIPASTFIDKSDLYVHSIRVIHLHGHNKLKRLH